MAAALTAGDPTLPAGVAQDQAQALYRQAVGIDAGLARAFLELGRAELARDQQTEAVELAEQASKAAPGWWPASALLIDALRARGFDQQSDAVLDRALAALPPTGEGGCRILQLAHDRAQARNRVAEEAALVERLSRCDAQSPVALERLRRQGDLKAAQALAGRQLGFSLDRQGLRNDLAALRLGLGDAVGAAGLLRASLDRSPGDAGLRVRLADAWQAAGRSAEARALLASTVRAFPGRETIRQVATIAGLPLPLDCHGDPQRVPNPPRDGPRRAEPGGSPRDCFRRSGREVIAEYQKSRRDYAAPAVLVLDRTVLRVLADGTQAILTHNIVNVKTKDGIARWGEVQIPESAEILGLRTHKADGRVREAEEIVGKASISAPELDAGDFVEWETIEYREPAEGFSPGFLADRFYFQSVELPLHLSELVVVVPEALRVDVDRRAGAPAAEVSAGPEPGTRQLRFAAREMPQLFAERSAVPHVEWIPSVRLSSGLSLEGWARVVAERLVGVARSSPALREVARQIAAQARQQKQPLGPAVVAWVTEHIEAEGGVVEPATATLARRRGNRAALVVALARALGLPAELALARSPVTADPRSRRRSAGAGRLRRRAGSLRRRRRRRSRPLRRCPLAARALRLPAPGAGWGAGSAPAGWAEGTRAQRPPRSAGGRCAPAPGGRRQRRGHGDRAPAGLAGHRVGRGQETRRRGRGQAAPGLRAALAGAPLLGRAPGRPGHRRRPQEAGPGAAALFIHQPAAGLAQWGGAGAGPELLPDAAGPPLRHRTPPADQPGGGRGHAAAADGAGGAAPGARACWTPAATAACAPARGASSSCPNAGGRSRTRPARRRRS